MKNLKTSITQSLALFFTGLVIPLSPSSQWHAFEFTSQMPNKIEHLTKELKISVNQSASPLIYVLKKPQKVSQINVEFQLEGYPKPLPNSVTQGFKGSDDFALRVGLIYEGGKKMNWLQRQLAPDWLNEMEKLLPIGKGIGRVYFVTTCRDPKIKDQRRKHFLNSTMEEECTTLLPPTGLNPPNQTLRLKKSFKGEPTVLGLWVTADGDDLGSQFVVKVKKIELLN